MYLGKTCIISDNQTSHLNFWAGKEEYNLNFTTLKIILFKKKNSGVTNRISYGAIKNKRSRFHRYIESVSISVA